MRCWVSGPIPGQRRAVFNALTDVPMRRFSKPCSAGFLNYYGKYIYIILLSFGFCVKYKRDEQLMTLTLLLQLHAHKTVNYQCVFLTSIALNVIWKLLV